MWKFGGALAGAGLFIALAVSVDARQPVGHGAAAQGHAPAAVLCEEQSASVGQGDWIFGSRRDPVTDVFALVTDPAQTCLHPDVQAAAGYESAGSCYVMRRIGTGDADLPMACTERHGAEDTGGVTALQCTGWNTRVSAMVNGGFSLTIGEEAETARQSRGVCNPM